MLLAICKGIFSYGIKKIRSNKSQIILSLNYTSRQETLKRKFGNLPVNYVKLSLENDEELVLFKEAMSRFSFNIDDIGETEKPLQINCSSPSTSGVKRLAWRGDDEANEGEEESRKKSNKTSINSIMKGVTRNKCQKKLVELDEEPLEDDDEAKSIINSEDTDEDILPCAQIF